MDADVAVIGSGAGGLTAAVALAQAGRKVIVFEQHYVPGGLCHSFTLGGYHFNSGVHYLGEFGPDGFMRRVYEGLGVSGDVQFSEVNPDAIDHVRLGTETFDIPKGREAFADMLGQRFPSDAEGVADLLRTCEEMARELIAIVEARRRRDLARALARATVTRRWAPGSGRSLVNHFVRDPLCRAVLNSRCGNHGLPPSTVAGGVHAALLNHYLTGAFYPIGGGAAIARAFVRALERVGGEIHLSTRVARILVERGRAIGVRLADGREVRAAHVLSNADPSVTLGTLVDRDDVPWLARWMVDRTRYSLSTLSMFMAVDMDLRAAGMDSGNYWTFRDADIERAFREASALTIPRDVGLDGIFLSAVSLKDPTIRRKGVHTVELFRLVNHAAFAKYAGPPEGKRGAEYEALKERVMDNFVATLDAQFPGFRERVVFRALGTPLTNAFYTCGTHGHTYGSEKSQWQAWPFGFRSQSGIENLSLCGASTLFHGILGATRSGLRTVQRMLDCEMEDLLGAGGPPLNVYSAEDLSRWPERMRTRIARGAAM